MDLVSMVETHQQPFGFSYSAVSMDQLDATEYTLVTVALDSSGSVRPYAKDLCKAMQSVLDCTLKSPRSENILMRVIQFNSTVSEIHPFLPVTTIDRSRYEGLAPGGSTALYDAVFSSVNALNDYAARLASNKYLANAITFVITDGDDNASHTTCSQISAEIARAVDGEILESNQVILIGVNTAGSSLSTYLDRFKSQVGITHVETLDTATPSSLAKLAQFVSKSISSQSMAIGTGGPSQLLSI